MSVTRWVALVRPRRESGPTHRVRSRWLPYIGVVLSVELVLLTYLLPHDLAFWTFIDRLKEPVRRAQHARHLAALIRHDPPLGTRLLSVQSAPLRAVQAKHNQSERILFLFVGPCTTCAAKDLVQWSDVIAAHGRKPSVIISRDSQQRIDSFVKTETFIIPVIADPDGTLAKSFNAVWTPRAYAVHADGKLTWIQTDDRMEPGAIADAVWMRRK